MTARTSQRGRWPAGLITLCTGVALERGAYYGLQSILALYLADLLADGSRAASVWMLPALARLLQVSGIPLAGVVTGAFVSAAVLTPVIGALIADRWLGQHRTILAGGGMMAAGHGLLVLDAALLPALGLIALGAGFFKGSCAARLSGLYTGSDPSRVDGFRAFYIAINIAGLTAPLVIGTIGERVAWHAGFGICCAAMLAGLAIYGLGVRAPEQTAAPQAVPVAPPANTTDFGALGLLGLAVAFLSIPNAQLTNSYLLWVRLGFDRTILGWEAPASWIIAADGLLSLAALAGTALFWQWHDRRRRELDAETVSVIGACFVVAGSGLLVLAALVHGRIGVPVLWGLGFQFLNSIGLANVFPAAMAAFGQTSARRYDASVMAGFFLSLFAGGIVSTWLASQFAVMPIALFWLLHALAAAVGACFLALLRRRTCAVPDAAGEAGPLPLGTASRA